jgi:hypothetical protein
VEKIPENILAAVKKSAPDNKISCAAARDLAVQLGVEPIVIGKAADELKIKIKQCQLGCF